MTMQGKNAGNPDGLPSILTRQRPKLTIENRGSDNSCHPRQGRQCKEVLSALVVRLLPGGEAVTEGD